MSEEFIDESELVEEILGDQTSTQIRLQRTCDERDELQAKLAAAERERDEKLQTNRQLIAHLTTAERDLAEAKALLASSMLKYDAETAKTATLERDLAAMTQERDLQFSMFDKKLYEVEAALAAMTANAELARLDLEKMTAERDLWERAIRVDQVLFGAGQVALEECKQERRVARDALAAMTAECNAARAKVERLSEALRYIESKRDVNLMVRAASKALEEIGETK